MSKNPFWELFRLSGETQESVAQDCQISRPTLSTVLWKDGIAPQVKWSTMNAIAKHFNKRIIVSFEPIEGDNGTV